MSTRYKLTCECGKRYPVEAAQAGRSIDCECGKTVLIPSMLRMKKLPEWLEDSEQKTEIEPTESENKSDNSLPPGHSSTKEKTRVLSGNRLGIFLIGFLFTCFFTWLLYEAVIHKPLPIQVFGKQIMFASGDKFVHRNSSPITREDFDFYIYTHPIDRIEYIIDDNLIDRMGAIETFFYFDNLKNGLELSENFYENFDELKYQYKVKIGACIVLLLISIVLLILPWLLPRHQKYVRTMRGTEWRT